MSPITSTSSSLPVLISGYYGFDNTGDEAILQSILQWFESRDDIHPVVLSADPKATFDAYGVDSIRRTSLLAILRRLFGSPVLIQGGGGLLQDSTSFKSLTYYLAIMFLGFITSRRVLAFAQGIGPLEGEFSPYLVGEFLGQCDLVCVRDFKSYAFCQSRLPLTTPLTLMADAALLLKPADPGRVEDIFLQENIDLVGKPLIGFSLKGPMKDRRQITSLARAIDMVNRNLDGGVALIPFHHPMDLEYAEAVRAMCEDKDSVAIVKGKYHPDEVLGLIGKFDLLVGMRLHSLIFAANRGVPFVPVSYDPKIDEFSGEFQIKPAVHTPLVGPEMLTEAIEETWENRGRIKAKIGQGVARLQVRTQDGFNALGRFMDSLELRRIGYRKMVKRQSTQPGKQNPTR
jgi:L-malate glycosyltransferase